MQRAITILMVTTAVVGLVVTPVAGEESESQGVRTVSQDLGYGEIELSPEAYFGDADRFQGRVDQRSTLNPLAGRIINWPTGYIAPAGSIVLSNQAIYGQRVAYSASDDFQFFGHLFLPIGNQSYAGMGAQFYAIQEESWTLTLGAQGRYRRTNFQPGTADTGAGLHAVLDVIATDNTTWNLGISAHVPVHQLIEEVDFSDCDSRRQWAEGECGTTTRGAEMMPRSGYWGALYLGVVHFISDRMTMEVEAFSGLSQGNFWALDSALDSELNYETERRIVEEQSWSAGLGPLGILTLGFGSTVRLGPMALQPGVYLTNYDGEARILPHLSVALAIGGSD